MILLIDFYKHKSLADGHQHCCIVCTKVYADSYKEKLKPDHNKKENERMKPDPIKKIKEINALENYLDKLAGILISDDNYYEEDTSLRTLEEYLEIY